MPASAMVFTDQSVLPVALPSIRAHLGATDVSLEWAVNSYLLTAALFVLAGGKLGDLFGHRRSFCIGMVIFALSSALCGLSPNILFLVLARALQGVGAALLFPPMTTLLMSLFSPKERGKAIGINVSVGSLFLILGPWVGGYFTEFYSWRWIFWINLPLSVIGLVLVLLFIRKSEPKDGKFDLLGCSYFVVSCTAFVVSVMQGRSWGWFSPMILSGLALFILFLWLLIQRDKRASHPFLDFSLFRHPIFRAVNISIFSTQFIMMIGVYRTIYFQEVLGWTPIATGTVMLFSSSPVLFMSPIGGILSDRFGPRLPIAIGFFCLIFSCFWISFFPEGSLLTLFFGLIVFSSGVTLVFTPSYASAMNSIPTSKVGWGFGTIATARSLAATLGVAMLGSLIALIQAGSFRRNLKANPLTEGLDDSVFEGLVEGSSGASGALGSLSEAKAAAVLEILKQSEIAGFVYSHVALALALILAFICVFVLYNRKSGHHLPDTPASGYD